MWQLSDSGENVTSFFLSPSVQSSLLKWSPVSDCISHIAFLIVEQEGGGVIQCDGAIYSWHGFNDFFKPANCVDNLSL